MICTVTKAWAALFISCVSFLLFSWLVVPDLLFARNVSEYKDTISTSAPGVAANHTLGFRLSVDAAPSSYIEITPPPGFEILATSSFGVRNVELLVNGTPRFADAVAAPGVDQVEIFPGSPGLIRYTLEPTLGVAAGSELIIKIGNHTSNSLVYSQTFSTTTGTSTVYGDVPALVNATSTGTHEVQMRIFDGGEVADAGFLIAIVEQVGMGPADTTETVPPQRFNPAPTSTIGGTTLSVEISLETDELAICRYATSADVPFASMTNTFSNTGFIFHSTVVPVAPNTVQRFYIRCIDDEGNINIDDFEIIFTVNDIPTGTANTDGNVSGDGSGSGNDGTGAGGGAGGSEGSASGVQPETGSAAGSGGAGGGGGGGRGRDTGSTAGGGFESDDASYPSGDGRVVITGYAFPRSRVSALVDGKQAGQATADTSGRYEITLEEIARGVYTFGVYALDAAQVRSSTFSTSFTVTGSRTTALSNINIAPSVKVSSDPVTAGQALTISGYALPGATITLENERDKSIASRKTFTATSDNSGAWSVVVDTNGLSNGTYKARARAAQDGGATTNFSSYLLYGVGESADRPTSADLNTDGKVNLTDFSILLFWWNTDGGSSSPSADINSDDRVNLTDFSIMLFNWTG